MRKKDVGDELVELVLKAVRKYGREEVLARIARMERELAWQRLPAKQKRRIEAAYEAKVRKRTAKVIRELRELERRRSGRSTAEA